MEEELAERMITDPVGTVEMMLEIMVDGVKKNIRNSKALFQIIAKLNGATLEVGQQIEEFYETLAEEFQKRYPDKQTGHEDYTE